MEQQPGQKVAYVADNFYWFAFDNSRHFAPEVRHVTPFSYSTGTVQPVDAMHVCEFGGVEPETLAAHSTVIPKQRLD